MKKVIIVLIIIAVIGVPLYLVLDSSQSQDDFYTNLNSFNLLLKEENYEQAKAEYDAASNTLKANYNISLDAYAQTLVEQAKRKETIQQSLNLLYSYNEIGYNSEEINIAILYYEELVQSNYVFKQGVEYYNDKQYDDAMQCFHDVLEYDDNYLRAQQYLDDYHAYNLAWEEASDNHSYGRSPQPNAIPEKNNYIYLPYKYDETNLILKINASTYSVQPFPLVTNENGAEISNLNIVGDYIFFMIEYNNAISDDGMHNAVYRISLDGDGLEKIAECDYTYLITYRDKFYAISPSRGIVLIDKHFLYEEVLISSDDEIIDMQLADGGLFYTTHNVETEMNTQYYYDGQSSEEILQEVNLHYYNYGDSNIVYYDSNAIFEYMYQEKNTSAGTGNNIQLYAGDIYKYYGMLNNSLIYTFVGDYQQECIRVKELKNYVTSYKAASDDIGYVPLGICYDEGIILLDSDAGISITTENMRIQNTIQVPHINNSVLTENEEKLDIAVNYYTDEPVETGDETNWTYSDDITNINTEKIYLDYLESTVYVSHIYTTDYRWLNVKQTETENFAQEEMGNIIWAAAGQSYNDELSIIDEDRGILDTDAYVYNDDGLLFAYREANIIPADKIISNNIVHVFTQGKIILDNYVITNDCLKNGGLFDGRSAIGMVEAGHYVVITAETPTKKNRGLSQYALAKLMQEQGCVSAFSFDYGYGPFAIAFDEYIYEETDISSVAPKYSDMLYFTVNE